MSVFCSISFGQSKNPKICSANLLKARRIYAAAIRDVIQSRRIFKSDTDANRARVAFAAFVEHSADSRHVLSRSHLRENVRAAEL